MRKAHQLNNDNVTKTVKITTRITGNKNVNTYYAKNYAYKFLILGDNGNTVGSNVAVKVTVNGKAQTLKTDKNVYITLKFTKTYLPKTYTVTAEYKEIKVTNKVKVKQILTLKKVKVKKSAKITVTLTNDGEVINNGTISFTVNSATYEAEVRNATAIVEIPNLNAGSYDINITYAGNSTYNSHTEMYGLIISKQEAAITGNDKSFIINYGGKYSVTVKGLSGAKVMFRLNGKVIGSAVTDKNGVASITLTSKMLKAAKAGKRNLIATLDDKNYQATKSFRITINKEKTKITAKAKSFKKSVNTKKYTITLKNSKGKAVNKVKVTLKVKGKTYNAKTNSKGKATFNIKKLTKNGKYNAKISFKGNACYKSSAKKVKIRVK